MGNSVKDAPWRGGHFAFFCNEQCEAFPCHEGIPEEDFNCLFCYCPLYALGEKCGGRFRYTERGIKDCSLCGIPHLRQNYGWMVNRISELAGLAGKPPKENPGGGTPLSGERGNREDTEDTEDT